MQSQLSSSSEVPRQIEDIRGEGETQGMGERREKECEGRRREGGEGGRWGGEMVESSFMQSMGHVEGGHRVEGGCR